MAGDIKLLLISNVLNNKTLGENKEIGGKKIIAKLRDPYYWDIKNNSTLRLIGITTAPGTGKTMNNGMKG
jgi:hypothetical protein